MAERTIVIESFVSIATIECGILLPNFFLGIDDSLGKTIVSVPPAQTFAAQALVLFG